ncbi:hypothetical protein M501DRAFT_992550 [Patellaria atrata CBS 101060]|uniref:PDZ GRASP-type domain-containing protein n=1 Tax=Patellaria atrata CBS 101060 TaxID=1346257 RepID=A0A9P4S9Y1_9PEZI|nr:hypothetical protein M501DRAFT_992550 [Patellaria atrata CBS 101060]
MFGALNRFISRLDSDAPEQKSATQGAYGFQVLKNTNQDLAIEPWFDFIIGINGHSIDSPDPSLFATEVRNSAGSTINLGLWSAKGQRIHELYVTVPSDPPSLGLSLQWAPLGSTEDVWHILDVIPNSPADVAGLLPYGDYVIGSPEGLMKGESGLGELVEDFLNRPLRLFVYNHEYNVARIVTIIPSRNWGGTGALGCVLGFGALHRIPAPLDEPPQAPGETLFDAPADEKSTFTSSSQATTTAAGFYAPADYLVPANIEFTPTSSSPQASTGPPKVKAGKKQRHFPQGAGAGLDDLLREGEEKSREEDYGGRSGAGTPLPPPPTGGPPKATSPIP